MIQRLQSLWLLLAAVFSAITFRFPFYVGDKITDATLNTVAHVDLNASTTIWLSILTVLAGGLAFVNIFLFSNRKLQLKLSYLGIFITVVLLVVYFLETGNFVKERSTFALSCIFHFAILGFYILAARGIWNDEKLIKDMDRLR
jgi:hypothetical protein